MSGVVEFLIQHALFVCGEAAAVLRGHVVRFLMDHLEPMMQRRALRRRVVALIHALVDAAAQVIDSAVDLMQTLVRDLLWAWARRGRRLRRHHAGDERNQQGACGNRAKGTGHGLSGGDFFGDVTGIATDDRGGALTGEAGKVVTLYSSRRRQADARAARSAVRF
jgi:hypothetical protein